MLPHRIVTSKADKAKVEGHISSARLPLRQQLWRVTLSTLEPYEHGDFRIEKF